MTTDNDRAVDDLAKHPEAATLQRLFARLFSEQAQRGMNDLIYFECLLQDFGGNIDLINDLKQFHAWSLDQPSTRRINHRARFRLWLSSDYQDKSRHA